ncbi:hypothetical protein D0Y65_045178 [Glycine soja]|uniref:Uncharacterized protein n=1 Tax=Glycine soja TaxID=3848 RepID=A0A445G3K2_GLYSO|nr:hypothetical protein D0Y65_045178 [Glycine soja]
MQKTMLKTLLTNITIGILTSYVTVIVLQQSMIGKNGLRLMILRSREDDEDHNQHKLRQTNITKRCRRCHSAWTEQEDLQKFPHSPKTNRDSC